MKVDPLLEIQHTRYRVARKSTMTKERDITVTHYGHYFHQRKKVGGLRASVRLERMQSTLFLLPKTEY